MAVVIFRGGTEASENPAFGPQALKNLRAIEGDFTRLVVTREQAADVWSELTDDGKPAQGWIVYIDPTCSRAFPLRAFRVLRADEVDDAPDRIRLSLELGKFIAPESLPLDHAAEEWGLGSTTPHGCLLKPYGGSLPTLHELPYEKSRDRWKRAIDFLTTHWTDVFDQNVFLRLEAKDLFGWGEVATRKGGAYIFATSGEPLDLTVRSYNPHLSDGVLELKRLTVNGPKSVEVLAGYDATINPNGEMTVSVRPLLPGTVDFEIGVQPQANLHTLLPVRLDVSGGEAVANVTLDERWRNSLDRIQEVLSSVPAAHMQVLECLANRFPRDPGAQKRYGRLLFDAGEFADAHSAFMSALEQAPDSNTAAWCACSALAAGDIKTIDQLQPLPDYNDGEIFGHVSDLLTRSGDQIALRFVNHALPLVPGRELKLLESALGAAKNEDTAIELADLVWKYDHRSAVRALMEAVERNADWRSAGDALIDRAVEIDDQLVLERYQGTSFLWKPNQNAELVRSRLIKAKKSLTAERFVLHCLENARALRESQTEETVAAEFVLDALETVVQELPHDIGLLEESFILASECVVDLDGYWTERLSSLEAVVERVLTTRGLIEEPMEEWRNREELRIRLWLGDRSVVVWGAIREHEAAHKFAVRLGVNVDIKTFDQLDEGLLRTRKPDQFVLLLAWRSMRHLSSRTKHWIADNAVLHTDITGTGPTGILRGLAELAGPPGV